MAAEIAARKLKHAEHLLEVVRGAKKLEAVRQKKLRHATSKENLAYLQKRWVIYPVRWCGSLCACIFGRYRVFDSTQETCGGNFVSIPSRKMVVNIGSGSTFSTGGYVKLATKYCQVCCGEAERSEAHFRARP